MQKRDQRVYVLTVEEASEAFAEYIAARTGEKFGTVSKVSIAMNPEDNTISWTVTPVKKELVEPIVVSASPQGSGVLN